MKKLIVSPAPHIHSKENTQRLMLDVIIALLPAYLVSVYFFGLGALNVAAVAVISCLLVEYAIERWVMKRKSTVSDLSAVLTGLLLAMNLPSNIPWWIVFIGAVVAIGIAKMSFGGLGQNVFNPALVGRVFLLISFPVQMTSWPRPDALWSGVDAATGATPLAIIKEGLAKGETVEQIMNSSLVDFNYWHLLFGKIGGSLGEISAIALLLGFAYLLIRHVIRPHIPLSIFGTVIIFSGILWLADSQQYVDPLFHLLTGGVMLGAIFMATDYVTSPMNPKAMVIYGIGIGLLTILIRVFGSYPEGISFAILIMNAAVPLLNRYIKPKRYGEEVKHG
ncbi:MAG: RnfABCDGE type electron transport complex subunit D [Bacteroidales bacterium]|nr:RnfABCDGE type electron transport complex subunit D [Bacteroidales bacterium]MCL2133152.1 RnfABCDGE type electron transport complex subunit D [Bacteroidales bacterium]